MNNKNSFTGNPIYCKACGELLNLAASRLSYGRNSYCDFKCKEIYDQCQTIADLKADGERLAERVAAFGDPYDEDVLELHTALYKRLEGE